MSDLDQARRTEYLPLRLVPGAVRNPKKHHGDIRASIDRFGFADGLIMDERTGRIVAGHGRKAQLEAMRDAGDDPPDGILCVKDNEWLVPVQRGWSSRSDAEAEAFLVAHNKLTEAGGWDEEGLADLLAGLDDLEGLGFGEDELDDLLGEEEPEGEDPGASEPPGEPVSKRGEIYALGPHRLMCGDSTSEGDVGRLLAGETAGALLTDPPYGMNLDTDFSSIKGPKNALGGGGVGTPTNP